MTRAYVIVEPLTVNMPAAFSTRQSRLVARSTIERPALEELFQPHAIFCAEVAGLLGQEQFAAAHRTRMQSLGFEQRDKPIVNPPQDSPLALAQGTMEKRLIAQLRRNRLPDERTLVRELIE